MEYISRLLNANKASTSHLRFSRLLFPFARSRLSFLTLNSPPSLSSTRQAYQGCQGQFLLTKKLQPFTVIQQVEAKLKDATRDEYHKPQTSAFAIIQKIKSIFQAPTLLMLIAYGAIYFQVDSKSKEDFATLKMKNCRLRNADTTAGSGFFSKSFVWP